MSQAVTESRKPMQRNFFVSYARVGQNGAGLGFSHLTLSQNSPMTVEAFKGLTTLLKEQNPGWDCIVLSFQELEPAEETANV
jgi:hypothetical protein